MLNMSDLPVDIEERLKRVKAIHDLYYALN